jgi:hypothetical protein
LYAAFATPAEAVARFCGNKVIFANLACLPVLLHVIHSNANLYCKKRELFVLLLVLMAHRLTDRQMLRGVLRALENSRTPKHLRPGLRRLRDRLQRRIEAVKQQRKNEGDFLSQLFGF